MTKLPYAEGTWFAVPLRDGGYASGLVSRMAPTGRVLLGYFFGPRRAAAPRLEDVRGLVPADAVLVQRFGDLYLIERRWPILGRYKDWQRDAWPIPLLVASSNLTEVHGGWSTRTRIRTPSLERHGFH
jgi:hypothetical protein